jgi:hypothetical protein
MFVAEGYNPEGYTLHLRGDPFLPRRRKSEKSVKSMICQRR